MNDSSMTSDKNSNETVFTAVRVSVISIIINTVLSVFKIAVGFFSHSSAMVSDGFHSASDVFSSFIVIIGVKLSAKKSDSEHPYGHERLECVAAIILAGVLLVTGCFIGASALENIVSGNSNDFVPPGRAALAAAFVSIAAKEAMFWFTRYYAKQIDSSAVMADAWHHRSDALSSVGALIGIAGARNGLPILEPLASLVICAFIIKAALDIFRDAINKMVDHSCDSKTEEQIRSVVMEENDVIGIDLLKTRIFGSMIYADIEIVVDGSKTIYEGHNIAERVHDTVEKKFPKIKHIMIHVNPD